VAEGRQARDEERRRQQERRDRARDRRRGLTPPEPKLTGSKSDDSKHPRGRAGTPEGGQFVRNGSGRESGDRLETLAVQRTVGAKEDGEFGDRTEVAVKRFQQRHGLQVDGVVGKQTASAMLGNRSASKLNTGAVTDSQRKRLRSGGQLREDEMLLEFALGSLARGARKYVRVGGGHGSESGRFSKRPIAAIGHPGGAGTARTFREKASRRQVSPEERQRQASKALGRKLGPSAKAREVEAKTPKPHQAPKSEFSPGGRGERIGTTLNEAEDQVVERVRASAAYKDAVAEMEKRKAVETLAKAPDLNAENTQTLYGGKLGEAHRVYDNKVRQALHAEIIKAFTQGTAPPKGQTGKPDVLFMAGGGASGKSTILGGDNVQEPERAVLNNADAIKACLPEYQAFTDSPDDDMARKAAFAVHEESSDLVKRLTRYSQMIGANYVVDGTGDSSKGKFTKALNEAAERGGNVRVTYATTHIEDAVMRAEARFQSKRRYIAPEILYQAHQGAAANFIHMAENTAYPTEIYDTTVMPPKLIAERKAGKGKGLSAFEIKDQAAWSRFIARAEYVPGKSKPDFMPTKLLTGRDLMMALDSGRVKLTDLTPGQIAEVRRMRQEKRQTFPGAEVAKAVAKAAEFRSKNPPPPAKPAKRKRQRPYSVFNTD
jgi:hypothetical protein